MRIIIALMLACTATTRALTHSQRPGALSARSANNEAIERASIAERVAHAERIAHAERLAQAERMAHEERLVHAERVAHEERLAHAERIAHAERLAQAERIAHEERLALDKMSHPERAPHAARPHHGNRIPHSERPTRSDQKHSDFLHSSENPIHPEIEAPREKFLHSERPDHPTSRPVAILDSHQINTDQFGSHSASFEAENGIQFEFSGSEGINGGANMIGSYSYPMEDGTIATFNFVADENGYQPQSDLLPVAPAFPHPIPQFVLEQIEFAALEDERRLLEEHHHQEYE